MRRKQFWPPEEAVSTSGMRLEIRAQLAWNLLERYALIAGTRGPEDSQGRAATDLLAADVVVDRCFRIADLFVDRALERKELREFSAADVEQAYKRSGELARIRNGAEYPPRKAHEMESMIKEAADESKAKGV